jgi:glycosyltransferase involved in cell wall biosynthesis
MKRVLHLTFDMRIGGTEQVIKNIIEGSDKSLFEMSVFCLEQPLGPFGEMLVEQGIKVTGLNRQPGFDLSVVKQLRKYMKDTGVQILHCHQYTPWVYGTLAAIGTGIPVIFTEHGRFYPDRTSWKRRVVNPVLARLTQRITAISKATRQALSDFEFIPENRIQVIYNGIHPISLDPEGTRTKREELGIENNTLVLGTIARFDPIKNHSMLFRSFKTVLEEFPDTRLLMVGDGDERAHLENLASELGIADQVIFTGYIEKPSRYMELMDIFVLPSLSEGTSMTLLEAMSLSRPCIVTDAGGNPEIVDHEINGLVTPNDDQAALTAAIKNLLGDSSRREQMAAQSLEKYIQRFTAAKMCSAFERIYTSLRSH